MLTMTMMLTLVLAGLGPPDGPDPHAALAVYPDEARLQRRLNWHRKRELDKHFEPIRVALSLFPKGDPFNQWRGLIAEDGRTLAYLDVYDLSRRHRRLGQLSDEQRARVAGHLAALPDSAPRPPLDDLLIVSFATGDRWESRTYHRSRLPAPVRELCQLAGLGLDTP